MVGYKELSKNAQEIENFVLKYASALKREDVEILDVGAGDGHLLNALHSLNFKKLNGVVYSRNEFLFGDKIDVFSGVDLSDRGWDRQIEKKYDFIICTEVLEHQTCAYCLLSGIRSLLKKDGVALLTFPNVHSFVSKLRFLFWGRYSGFFGKNFNSGHPLHDQHIFIPNHMLVKYLASVAGLEVVKIGGIGARIHIFAKTTFVLLGRKS